MCWSCVIADNVHFKTGKMSVIKNHLDPFDNYEVDKAVTHGSHDL